MTTIVYGPAGCGKTRNSALLADHFGASRVVDGWQPGMRKPAGALLLTNVAGVRGAVPYSSLQAQLNLP